MNNTVYFNPEWMEALSLLGDEERNAVISGIVTYQISGQVPDHVARMAAFVLLRIEVDRRNRRIARDRRRRAQSAPKSVSASPAGNPVPQPAALDAAPDREVRQQLPASSVLSQQPPAPARSSDPTPPPVDQSVRPKRPDLTPEKKAAIASLVESLLQPRRTSDHTS